MPVVHSKFNDKELQDTDGAMKEYEIVLANYPESLLLEEVRKKIRELGIAWR